MCLCAKLFSFTRLSVLSGLMSVISECKVDSRLCGSSPCVTVPRVREAAMSSLMDVTVLVASDAPEILSPDL